MISFTVRLRFLPEDHDEVHTLLQKLGAASRQEPGCVNYITHFVEGDPTTVVIYEQYRDAEALGAHRASPHFAQYGTAGLYTKLQDRVFEHLVEVR